ncbi:hypothetical protein M406DRAFT_69714 [Cryphonectria parasitica EP155]|uniref:Uncharacterized protein n=1 Tax=Cryphonectria parasitica (strain ATCC 38755 / EP155) TaxID=660469 RepID=A0A9P4Y6Y4_CRYP1|nr:uncharacterized protein M406DRAFT_69714 [Cryphonectria parasitica EP155]KAF3767579.1 hypothetical protein M406DRAFT_69714 [Cryphonectria parasitica EP155]
MVNVILASSAVSAVAGAKTTSLLPYIPTTILIPGGLAEEASSNSSSNDNSTAYILSPNDDGSSVDLLSLDISSTLASSSLTSAVTTLTSGLPFLSSTNTTSFSPTLAADGSILVFAGDCASDDSSSVWIYNTTSGKAAWKEQQDSSSLDGTTGPNFLGGGVAFSEVIAPSISTPQIYSYGGQCPNATINGSTTWVNAADYSNAMIRLTSSSSADGYEAEILSLASQPVAEAGFTFTQLPPSTSNISGTVTQTVNSIVLGGHTRNAFVNISTAAIWSLPEESWSYVAISGPSGASSSSSVGSELAKNEDGDGNVQVQSRSGHTAVLNEAGTALIILGGWVGNTSTPAEPQLVVLDLSGSAFGEWTWVVPEDQPLTGGEGIFGHGAALLPGNVMMVAGGYSVSSSSSTSKLRTRDSIGVAGGQLKTFLNLTSLSWSDSYTNPTSSSSSSSSGTGSSSSSSTDNTKLGLEVGLGAGIPLLLIFLCVAFFCFRRRQRHRHAHRDEHIRGLTSGAPFITPEEMYETEHEQQHYPWVPKAAARWYSYTGGHDPYLRDEKSLGYESLRGQRGGPQQQQHHDFGGLASIEPPLGYRGPTRRKPNPRVAQGLYQPTGVDESRTFAAISPIMEDEEDEMSMHGAMSPDKEVEGTEDDPFVTPVNDTMPSPFVVGNMNPPSSPTAEDHDHVYEHDHRAPTPMPTLVQPQQQHPEVTGWVTDVDASDALITRRLQPRGASVRMGKISPTRRSSVRFADGESTPTTPGARTESGLSDSNRSAFSFLVNRSDSLRVAAPGAGGGLLAASGASGGAEKRGGTSHSDHSSSSNSNSSFITAKSIPALQTEGPTLLLGRPRPISDIEDLTHVSDDDGAPGSPSKSKTPRRSWFGSLRRVFSGPSSSGSSAAGSNRTESPTRGDTSDYDRWGLGGGLGLGGYGLLQKRKQGRSAWEDYIGGGTGGFAAAHADGHGDEEDDWDVERSAEQRLVQVMFSVPKERLRIVNGEPDVISIAESAVIVDPEHDGDNGDDDGEEGSIGGQRGGDGRRRPSLIFEEEREVDSGRNAGDDENNEEEQMRRRNSGKAGAQEKGKQPEEVAPLLLVQRSFESATNEKGKDQNNSKEENTKRLLEQRSFESATNEKVKQDERKARLLEVPQLRRSEDSSHYEGRRSLSPGVPMQAEEVRYERPRTRVLDLVETFEQRSRSNSPTKERLTPERSW